MTSTFVSALKKFGEDVVKAGKAILGVPTFVIQETQNIPQAVNDIKTIVELIKTAEAMFAAAGQQKAGGMKLAAVSPYVASIVQDVEAFGGNKIGSMIKDTTGFNAGIQKITDGFAEVLNACGE